MSKEYTISLPERKRYALIKWGSEIFHGSGNFCGFYTMEWVENVEVLVLIKEDGIVTRPGLVDKMYIESLYTRKDRWISEKKFIAECKALFAEEERRELIKYGERVW